MQEKMVALQGVGLKAVNSERLGKRESRSQIATLSTLTSNRQTTLLLSLGSRVSMTGGTEEDITV